MAAKVKGPREVFVPVWNDHGDINGFAYTERKDVPPSTREYMTVVRYIRADLFKPAKKTTAKKKNGGSQ